MDMRFDSRVNFVIRDYLLYLLKLEFAQKPCTILARELSQSSNWFVGENPVALCFLLRRVAVN